MLTFEYNHLFLLYEPLQQELLFKLVILEKPWRLSQRSCHCVWLLHGKGEGVSSIKVWSSSPWDQGLGSTYFLTPTQNLNINNSIAE